jgi:hypothetical protein
MMGGLSGASADLGPLLAIVITLFWLGLIDPSGMLVGFGLFILATAVRDQHLFNPSGIKDPLQTRCH